LQDDPKKFRIFDFRKNRVWSEGLSFVMQIGLTMAGSIVFCFFVGLYLDKWLGTRGLFVTVFILLGVVGGAYTTYRQIQESFEKDERRRKNAASENGDGKH
jgi:ATP synthase protein I